MLFFNFHVNYRDSSDAHEILLNYWFNLYVIVFEVHLLEWYYVFNAIRMKSYSVKSVF